MEGNDDFTFCQVGSPNDQDDLEMEKALPDVSTMTIKDKDAGESVRNKGTGVLWKDQLQSNAIPKEATVGSLSFNVIDASRAQSYALPKQVAFVGSQSTANRSESKKQMTPPRKPAVRAKVPFEKGYSQMDWLKLTQTHPDLAGLKGQSNRRLISLNEVKQHKTGSEMWTVLKGRVYNIAPYMKFHPGGVDMLMKGVGKDCTSIFNKYHAWVNADALLEKCLVGILDSQ